MNATAVEITALDPGADLTGFDCGEPARNAWLLTRAASNQRSDDTRTYIARRGTTAVGFHAITVGSVIRSTLPGSLRRNAPDPVSCVLLAQLAVSLQHQGGGLGRALVLHAMQRAVKIAEIAGCRLFAVHPARPDLVRYYQGFGFTEVATAPALMAMGMTQARSTLAAVQARLAAVR